MVIQETPKAESLQEQRLKISLKAVCARHAEWESNTSRKRNKDSIHPQNIAILRTEGQNSLVPLYSLPTLRKSKNIKKRKIFHSGAGKTLEFMMSVRNLVGWTDKRN